MVVRKPANRWLGNGAPTTGVIRQSKTYCVDPDIHARIMKYAKINNYSIAQVAECAFIEFLEKRCD
jgi:hypothetical protein